MSIDSARDLFSPFEKIAGLKLAALVVAQVLTCHSYDMNTWPHLWASFGIMAKNISQGSNASGKAHLEIYEA